MSMEIKIRRARREDLPAFLDVYIRAYRGLEDYAYTTPRRIKAYFHWLITRDRDGVFVAEVSGQVVGFICSDSRWISDYAKEEVGAIHELVVLPEYRRMGVARRLMEKALEYLKGRGRSVAELWVGVKNRSAKRFYESLGFQARDVVGKWLRMVKIF
jgi:ribosomal protein S18 acetylase RimI-like enzyme